MADDKNPAPAPTPDPAAAPAPAAPANPTIAATPDPAAPPSPAPAPAAAPTGDWRDDWRDKLAEGIKPGDKEFRKRLDRFGSPVDIGKSWSSLEQKMSSGEFKSALPENATAEQLSAWRKANGIPEKAEDYKIELPNGVVLGEADKPIVEGFLKDSALAGNMTAKQVNGVLSWYYGEQDRQMKARAEADDNFRRESEDALRSEWGGSYRANINAIGNMFANSPEGLFDSILTARLPNGRLLGDDPGMIKEFARIARELNPLPTALPPGVDTGKAVEGRLEEIRKFRRENPDAYDQDKKMQAEELQLIEAEQRMKGRKAA